MAVMEKLKMFVVQELLQLLVSLLAL
ncbi:hypothetical protein CCACVL1_28884, partial [Corchorus capsularis]